MLSRGGTQICGRLSLAALIATAFSSCSADPAAVGPSSTGNGPSSVAPTSSTQDTTGGTSEQGPGDPLPENQNPEPDNACLAPKITCNNNCINPASDPNHCGASLDCSPPNQGVRCDPGQVCSKGQCAVSCAVGEVISQGGCIDPTSNKDFCGAKLDCKGAHAGQRCAANQVCDAGQCAQDCGADELKCNGECVDPSSDARFCGATLDCAGANAGKICQAGEFCTGGQCKLECDAGTVECGGACINPLTDNQYCGAKGDCQTAGNKGETCPSGSICSNGECEVQCDAGLVQCEGSCIDPKSDNNFCGAMAECKGAIRCDPGQACVDGQCLMECPAGKIACGDRCIDPNTNNSFCGAELDCTGANAGKICSGDFVCQAGACTLACDPEEVECSGACINPKTDEAHCGAKLDCSGENAGQSCNTGSHECIDGSCRPRCEGGTIACGDACVDPRTDNNYCGATDPCDDVHKGVACSGQERCIAGICTFFCEFPTINCGGTCIDPRSDVSNCGAVGNCAGGNAGQACGANQACVNGRCELQCQPNEIACDDRCVDPKTDRDYCGANTACNGGVSCADDFICSNGVCERDCPAGQITCKDRCVDPQSDNTYCGASADCQDANSGESCATLFDQSCVGGSCKLVCPAGKVACGDRCIDPQTSQNHCGAKLDCLGANAGSVCQVPEQSCVAGKCENTGCGESQALVRPDPVVIELILDKSGSMAQQWESASLRETRWKSLHRAVLSLVNNYGPQDDSRGQAEFGALLFPAADAGLPYYGNQERVCAAPFSDSCQPTTDAWASSNPYQSCPQADGNRVSCTRAPYDVDSGLDTAWAPSASHTGTHFNAVLPHANAQAMESRWNRATFNDGNEANRTRRIRGGTPTAMAIGNAVNVLAQPRYRGRKRVNILISDGATTGTQYAREGGSCASSRANALERELFSVIRAAKQQKDIPTYVIGVDLQDSDQAGSPQGECNRHNVNPRAEANQMANAGGTDNAINVTDSAALNKAFSSILKDVLSCTIDIGDKPPYINDVDVHFPNPDKSKGPKIQSFWDRNSCTDIPGAQAGWVYANPGKTKIELCHGACREFKDRLTGELMVIKGCEGPE